MAASIRVEMSVMVVVCRCVVEPSVMAAMSLTTVPFSNALARQMRTISRDSVRLAGLTQMSNLS